MIIFSSWPIMFCFLAIIVLTLLIVREVQHGKENDHANKDRRMESEIIKKDERG